MTNAATEPAENTTDRHSLSAILTPIIHEWVEERMEKYVTKEYLDVTLAKLENKLLLYMSGLVGGLAVVVLAGVKLMLPATPPVVMMQSPFVTPWVQAAPAAQPPAPLPKAAD